MVTLSTHRSTLEYRHRKYQDTLNALLEMRKDIVQTFFLFAESNGYDLIVSDASGVIAEHRVSQDFLDDALIRLDLSSGVATVEHPVTLKRLHERLTRMSVPHDYHDKMPGPVRPTISMNIVFAVFVYRPGEGGYGYDDEYRP